MNEDEKKKQTLEEDEKKKTIDTIVEALTPKTIDGVYEKMKAEQPHRKHGILDDGSFTERQELADKQKQAADFFKAMERHDRGAVKTLSSGTAGNGLELVPTYVADQFIMQQQNYGLVRKNARKMPLSSISENIPTATTVTAYRLGSDVSPITSSQPATGAIQMRSKTVGVIVPVARVLIQNATAPLMDTIAYLAAKAIAKLEDQWAILGLASGEGVFQNTSVPVNTLASGSTTYRAATFDDLLNTEDLLDENFLSDKLRWAFSRSVLNNFRRIRSIINGTPNQPQGYLMGSVADGIPNTIWDIPYDTTAVMPKNSDVTQNGVKFAALIDWDNVILGDRMEYTMEMSDEATVTDVDGSTQLNLWQQNMVGVKVWEQIDIELANPTKAFGVLKTSAS
jgi:HK97 family phage major capsid protein